MHIPAYLSKFNQKPLWQKTILGIIVIALLFIAWPLAVAAVYTLIVLQTMKQPQTRVALIAAMIIPALIMEFTWGKGIVTGLVPQPNVLSQQSKSTPQKSISNNSDSSQVQGATTASKISVKVLQAVSGDTLDVDQDGQPYRVKLIGLQAPAMINQVSGKAECFGPESQMFLDSLLRGRKVNLEFDTILQDNAQVAVVDRYVLMEDGTQVNQLMLEAGLARPQSSIEFDLQAQFKAYAESAKAAKKGLWLNCDKPVTSPTPSVAPTKAITNPTSTPIPTAANQSVVTPIGPPNP